MADVDTENKRRSIDQVPGLEIYANPTGAIDVSERADATAIYAGFDYTVIFTGSRRKGLLMGVY